MGTLLAIAWSPLATALVGTLAGGLIAYLVARHGENATLREQQRRGELEFQAALRALLIEMFRGAELALSGSGTVLTWGSPSGKTSAELDLTAQAYEGRYRFPLRNTFGTEFGRSTKMCSSRT
jgi:membrane protein YqaA with SNARE-associated domain